MRKAPLFLIALALLASLALAQTLLPDKTFSQMENRVLAERPALTLASMSMSRWADGFETYCADQLPLRDRFVSLYTAWEALTGHRVIEGVILGGDHRLFDRTDAWKTRNVTLNASALAYLSEETGTPLYLLAVPSANAVYGGCLPPGAPVADEEALTGLAAKEVSVIPLLPALREKAVAEPLYYRTDHHWTAAGARIGYLRVCDALGLEPLPELKLTRQSPFYGSFYARCPLPWQQADTFEYPEDPSIRLIVGGEEKPGLADREKLTERDLYAALLYGNHDRMELVNDSVAEGTWFVIKDSYANALLPALARHCHRIVAIDARYFAGDVVEAVKETKGDLILCIHGVNSLASGRTLALLEGL